MILYLGDHFVGPDIGPFYKCGGLIGGSALDPDTESCDYQLICRIIWCWISFGWCWTILMMHCTLILSYIFKYVNFLQNFLCRKFNFLYRKYCFLCRNFYWFILVYLLLFCTQKINMPFSVQKVVFFYNSSINFLCSSWKIIVFCVL